jgi:hypothetical protein
LGAEVQTASARKRRRPPVRLRPGGVKPIRAPRPDLGTEHRVPPPALVNLEPLKES